MVHFDAVAKPILHGFAANMGLLLAIGPQTAFILRQGFMRQNILSVIMTCLLCDIMLISMGVLGLGGLLVHHSPLRDLVMVAGLVFLIFYGFMALKAAFHPPVQMQLVGFGAGGTLRVVVATLGVTLLNPLAYFDALVVLGGLSAQHPDFLRFWFLAGALTASTVWFFSLGFGARLIAPMFCHRVPWMVMNLGVMGIMWLFSWSLYRSILL